MKLYSIRDRLVGYYMQPFAAHTDHQVLAAVATQVNAEDNNAIAQAPHQFEIWSLAEIDDETGKVTARSEYICDCHTLIRRDLRRGGVTGDRQPPGTTGSRQEPPYGAGERPKAETGVTQDEAHG